MYHKDGNVDVKLLADIGYIAERLRSLEQKWNISELKDLHKKIISRLVDPPLSVSNNIENYDDLAKLVQLEDIFIKLYQNHQKIQAREESDTKYSLINHNMNHNINSNFKINTESQNNRNKSVDNTNSSNDQLSELKIVKIEESFTDVNDDDETTETENSSSTCSKQTVVNIEVKPSSSSSEFSNATEAHQSNFGDDANSDGILKINSIHELSNNFRNSTQFRQMCDNIDNINDDDFKLLIKELRRKIEFAEKMNWLCLSNRPHGPPHRKTSLPKHCDVKQKFLEVCNTTLSEDVKAALRLPAFDSYEWEDWDVVHLMQTMFTELNLIDKFDIPIQTLREWLYEVYKHYNDVPFHNYRHCFCVAQMMYAITWHTNLITRLGDLEVLILLVSCICHDLDHPGYNNIYQINARTELALRYNDISPLENHHCSIAFRLLEHPDCNIFRNMSKEMYKEVREGIIRCILATDMARHNEILTQFIEVTPIFDYNNKVHTNLLCMVLIKVADISNEARPMDVAEPWLDRLLTEFFAQSAAEKLEGLPVTPFMDPDKVSKPGSQVRFIGLVLLPLFEALGELLPELTDLIIMPVRVALDYYRRLNDVANKTRKSIAEAEASSESGGSPVLPRSQSGISVKSRRSIPSQKSASRTSVDEPILITAELHDLPEGSESGDSETATEVDVAEKTSKFKVDTESTNRKQSQPGSRKGSREKRPSMIGEYYTTGSRIRGSHGSIQHSNRTYFGSNRAISLDQYSNSRRMSDGFQMQSVASDNSVYYHQRHNRGLDHDYSSSDKSNSINSEQFQPNHQHHFHHHHFHAHPKTLEDSENMNVKGSVEKPADTNLVNNNSKNVNIITQQKIDKVHNNNNNNNNGTKSIISRLRQLTGRLSFNFDSKESKRIFSGNSGEECSGSSICNKSTTLKNNNAESSKSSSGFCCNLNTNLNQQSSISPIMHQRQTLNQRNNDLLANLNSARNRAYSLDVPITRNCCRSLSGSGGGSSCGGSHKSLTFSLNKSNDENDMNNSNDKKFKSANDKNDCCSSVGESGNKSGGGDSDNI